ncbi:MAG TPA: hypothetical protein VIL65_14045 [Beijerinckiaceae bacterium]
MTGLSFWMFAVGGAYALLAALTFAFLLAVGRKGLSRRALQFGGALAWPAYWLAIQGPRRSLVMGAKVLSCVLFALALPIIGTGFALALAFDGLSRRGLMPRFLSTSA